MRRNNKDMQIVWAMFFIAFFAQRVDAGIVRNPTHASGPQRITETFLLVSDKYAQHMAADTNTETRNPEVEYYGKGYYGKEQELTFFKYTLDELESEARKIRKEQIDFFEEKSTGLDRIFVLRTQMRKQGSPAAEQGKIETQIRELKAQQDRLDRKIKEFDPPLQKLEQKIAKVEQWILDIKVTADDSEDYINELYDQRILIRPDSKAKYERERNKWLKLKKKSGGKGLRQKGKGGASVS